MMAYRKTEKVLSKIAATRNLLIACAIDIMAADGIEALTIRTLAERAEIATGSIYMHFADTKELIIAVATELRDRDIEAMHQAREVAQRPSDNLIAGISMFAHIVASKYRLMSAIGTMPAYRDPVQDELAKLIKATSPKERPAILAAMAYGAIFETARLGVRAERTLVLCLLRAVGLPPRWLAEIPVF
jgi:AcrR family transcriptional regulator